jgi:uncharacterized protein YecE (DUF72 family)
MGWSYAFWIGNFYPPETKQEEFLHEYSKHFSAVEVDSTFYRTPSIDTLNTWKAQTPAGFVFSPKLHRSITHEQMLKGSGERLEFFARRVSLLGDKLGPVLIQLSPQLKRDRFNVLKDFLLGLPETLRFALEVRSRDWLDDRLHSLLTDKGVALAMVDNPWMPKTYEVTAGFVYIRWEGNKRKVKGSAGKTERNRRSEIEDWADRIGAFLDGSKEVFGYFSKFYSGHSPTDVRQLLRALPIQKRSRGTKHRTKRVS